MNEDLMPRKRNLGRFPISNELLIRVLGLPDDTKIINSQFNQELGQLELLIEHKDIKPVCEGCVVPIISAQMTNIKSHIRFDKWEQ